MAWESLLSMIRKEKVFSGRQFFIHCKDLLLWIQDRMTEGYFRNGGGYRE